MIGASICQIATAKAKYKYKDEDPSFRYYSDKGSTIAKTKYLLGECVRSLVVLHSHMTILSLMLH